MKIKQMLKKAALGGLMILGLSGIGCGTVPTPGTLKTPVCSYAPIEESLEQKAERLGQINEGCREIIPGHNDASQRRINIVFVGLNDTPEHYISTMQDCVDCTRSHGGILDTEPFTSNIGNFNFWYVDKVEEAPEEDILGMMWYPFAHISEKAKECNFPNKAIVGLTVLAQGNMSNGIMFEGLNLEQMNLSSIESIHARLEGLDGVFEEDENGNYPFRPFQCYYAADATQEYGECTVENVAKHLNVQDIDSFMKWEGENYTSICAALEELKGAQGDIGRDGVLLCDVIAGKFGFPMVNLDTASLLYEIQDINPGEEIPKIATHEVSHNILGLRDEYINNAKEVDYNGEEAYLRKIQSNPINCFAATTKSECEANAPWKDMPSTGCFQGCGYRTEVNGTPLWRSVDKGLMSCEYNELDGGMGRWNELDDGKLGAWNLSRACKAIYIVTHNASGICTEEEPEQ